MSELWLPGVAGPQDEFVARLHRRIQRFAESRGIAQAVVEVELRDGARFKLDAVMPEPGYGFVTLRPHADEEDVPDELIVPIGAIGRIELYATAEQEPKLGFSVPKPRSTA